MTTAATLDKYVRGPQPVLPESQSKYLQEELRKIEVSLGGAFGALTSTGPYFKTPHAMLMSTQSTVNAGTTSENPVTYNQTILADGVRVQSNSQIWFDHPGYYLITARFQFSNLGNDANEINVWAKNTGAAYPLSNVAIDIQAKKSASVPAHAVTTITGIFDVQNVGTNYLELVWWSDGADVSLESHAIESSPTRPAAPAVVLTTKFISGL